MNSISAMGNILMWLRRLPRSFWIVSALVLMLVPVLLVWLLFSVFSGTWQAGSSLLGQSRETLNTVLTGEMPSTETTTGLLPSDVQERLQTEVDRVRAAIPASAEELQQKLAGVSLPAAMEDVRQTTEQGRAKVDQVMSSWLAPVRPTTDVGGEDPPGVTRLPGFVRTEFARDGDRLQVSLIGDAPHGEVVAYYKQQLIADGYSARVLKASAQAEKVEFESADRKLTLEARDDGRGGSELNWEVL